MPDAGAYAELIERLAAEDAVASMGSGLNQLPGEQREALELRVPAGLDYDEVGRGIGISSGAGRVRVFRALASLRAQLGEKP